MEDTLSSSDHDSSSLSHIGLFGFPFVPRPGARHPTSSPRPSSAITCKAISAHFLRNNSREEGGTYVPLFGATAGSFSFRKKKKRARHAARTSLAHSRPRMLCVITHYPLDPGLWKKPTSAIVESSLHKVLGPRPPRTIFQHFSALSSATIGSLRCSSKSANRFSPRSCLHALDRSILLPHPWLPSFSRGLLLSGPPMAS